MRKIYMLFLLLACSLGYLQAQGWYVYEGNDIPDALPEWTTSSKNPGPNFDESILNDPFIPGNKYLRYLNCDEWEDATKTTNSRKYYRHNFTGNNPALTLVTRVKGESVDTITGERIFQIEYNMGAAGVRDALTMYAEDSILKLERNGASVKVNANLLEWHVYRIVFDVADSISTVYLDEDSSPVLTGKTTSATGNNYLRVGDGGSARIAGSMDWLIMDTTGVYAPGAGAAIPDSLSTDFGPQSGNFPGAGYDLAFVGKKSLLDTNGYYADSMIVVALGDAGFNVSVIDMESADLSTDDKAAIEATDVVVIGRTPGSNDLAANKDYFNKLQLPIVSMSTYGAPKMGWVQDSVSKVYGQVYGTQEGHVEVPGDTIFKNISVPGSGNIEFSRDFLSFDVLDPEEVANITGEVLITMVNGVEAYDWGRQTNPVNVDTIQFSDYDGYPLMIRWNPHVADTMYTGSNGAAARAFHYRTLIPGGDDHYGWNPGSGDEKVNGMYYFTETFKAVFINECAYLAGLDGLTVSDDNTLASLTVSVGSLDPAFTPGGKSYTVAVPEGTTSIDIVATANDANATVDGDGTIPFDGSDTTVVITVTSEAGTPSVINVLVKQETVVSDNIIPPGINTIIDYIKSSDYDEYILVNGGVYESLDPIVIDRKITLKAQDTVSLPALDNLPVIKNTFGVSEMIKLENGADLTLFGIDVDGDGSATMAISFLTDSVNNIVDGIKLVRCRIHGTTGDLLGGTKSDSVTIKNAEFRNSFIYDAGAHGLYVKDIYAKDGNNSKFIYSGLTFWDLGQQLVWIQVLTPDCVQEWEFDHMTGYNLSTGGEKELLGNSDGGGQYDITLTNSIFVKQISNTGDGAGSLRFTTENANGSDNIFDIRNIVLYDVMPFLPRDGSGTIDVTNQLDADPQFADPDNGDFTIGNTDYLTAGDDGTVLGALYWAPDFVDDYADYGPKTGIDKTKTEISLKVYPMPFGSEVNFSINLQQKDEVTISIIDVTGRTVKLESVNLAAGANNVAINTSDLDNGTYFYTVTTSKGYTTGNLIKAE